MDIEAIVKNTIKNNLDFPISVDEMDVNSKLADLGINSITYIRIIISIENELGIELEDDILDLGSFRTLKNCIDYVTSKYEQATDSDRKPDGIGDKLEI